MRTHIKSSRKQAGMMLLEGLLAILIFSIGVLAIVGMQGTALKQVADAKYRSEAGMLANQLIGAMWSSDRTTTVLQASFNSSSGGAGYSSWKSNVSANLPGVAAHPPEVAVDAAGIVTITIYWLAPSEVAGTDPHKYVTVAQLK